MKLLGLAYHLYSFDGGVTDVRDDEHALELIREWFPVRVGEGCAFGHVEPLDERAARELRAQLSTAIAKLETPALPCGEIALNEFARQVCALADEILGPDPSGDARSLEIVDDAPKSWGE